MLRKEKRNPSLLTSKLIEERSVAEPEPRLPRVDNLRTAPGVAHLVRGARWRWHWASEDAVGLKPFCVDCDFELVLVLRNDCFSERTVFECEGCEHGPIIVPTRTTLRRSRSAPCAGSRRSWAPAS